MTSHNQHAKKPVDLAGPTTGQTVRPESSAAHLTMGDLSTRRRDHAVAAEMRTPAELDAVPEHRERRVKATELLPDRGTYQHAAGGHAEPFLRLITLPLINLIHVELELPAALKVGAE